MRLFIVVVIIELYGVWDWLKRVMKKMNKQCLHCFKTSLCQSRVWESCWIYIGLNSEYSSGIYYSSCSTASWWRKRLAMIAGTWYDMQMKFWLLLVWQVSGGYVLLIRWMLGARLLKRWTLLDIISCWKLCSLLGFYCGTLMIHKHGY